MTTYFIADGEVERMVRAHPYMWPEHRLDRIITEAEHGETLMLCAIHEGWTGNVAEAAEHLAEGPWAAP